MIYKEKFISKKVKTCDWALQILGESGNDVHLIRPISLTLETKIGFRIF